MSKQRLAMSVSVIILTGCGHPSSDQTMQSEIKPKHAQHALTNMHVPVDLEKRDLSGATPLMRATRANDIAQAKALIEAGADVNAKDDIHDSPYLYAGARGHLEILNMTLQHGADLKSTNRYGGTALIPAAERGHVATVQRLIEAGVDVNHVNRLGWTALLEAVMLGDGSERYQAIVKALIKGGAEVNFKDPEGISILQHARQRGYVEITELLLQAGAHENT